MAGVTVDDVLEDDIASDDEAAAEPDAVAAVVFAGAGAVRILLATVAVAPVGATTIPPAAVEALMGSLLGMPLSGSPVEKTLQVSWPPPNKSSQFLQLRVFWFVLGE